MFLLIYIHRTTKYQEAIQRFEKKGNDDAPYGTCFAKMISNAECHRVSTKILNSEVPGITLQHIKYQDFKFGE